MSNHDRSACLLRNGEVVGAISEERIDRRKRSDGFYAGIDRGVVLPPMGAIAYVLRMGGISLDNVAILVCGRSISRCRDTVLDYVPISADRVVEPPHPAHHLSHAYSAFCACPFAESAILVVDEQGSHFPDGTFEKCSWFHGHSNGIRAIRKFLGTPDSVSLGMFYDIFAAVLGLGEAGMPAAGKLMGLATTGGHRSDWKMLINLTPKGDATASIRDLDLFFEQAGLRRRQPSQDINVRSIDDILRKYVPLDWKTDLARDIAFKAQEELEIAVLHCAKKLRLESDCENLVYAGGVALNAVVNSLLLEAGWNDVFVQPASTDDGAALGLAYYGWMELLGGQHKPTPFFSPFLGCSYNNAACERALDEYGLSDYAVRVSPATEAAAQLQNEKIVCWFQGRSEWGPRALGARSILANPTTPQITQRLNSEVKFRESFRPFAISGVADELASLLELSTVPISLRRYMLAVARISDPRLESVAHHDGSIRFHVVDARLQPLFHDLLSNLDAANGLRVVINTSFNVCGEPLVETPTDAVRQFLLCGAPILVMNEFRINTEEIPKEVVSTAVLRAIGNTGTDPLHMANSLATAGYPERAEWILNQCKYDESRAMQRGCSNLATYRGLMLRILISKNDVQAARDTAVSILNDAGFSDSAYFAAAWLAEHGKDSWDEVGKTLHAIGSPGGAMEMCKKIFSTARRP